MLDVSKYVTRLLLDGTRMPHVLIPPVADQMDRFLSVIFDEVTCPIIEDMIGIGVAIPVHEIAQIKFFRNDVMNCGDDFFTHQVRVRNLMPAPVRQEPDDVSFDNVLDDDVRISVVPLLNHAIADPVFICRQCPDLHNRLSKTAA